MATRVAAVEEVTGVEEMERQLVELVEQVEWEKEKTRVTFQQLHSLLVVRAQRVLRELDEVVVEARQEFEEKREVILELQRAKESAERELTKNILKKVLEKNSAHFTLKGLDNSSLISSSRVFKFFKDNTFFKPILCQVLALNDSSSPLSKLLGYSPTSVSSIPVNKLLLQLQI